jgi:hypothetical protein
MVYQLASIAKVIRAIIRNAEQSGTVINENNIVHLLCDNLPKNIHYSEIGSALDVAGFRNRFPDAIHRLSFMS